jgi:hypothetical protein
MINKLDALSCAVWIVAHAKLTSLLRRFSTVTQDPSLSRTSRNPSHCSRRASSPFPYGHARIASGPWDVSACPLEREFKLRIGCNAVFECFAKDHFLQEQTDRSSVDALMQTQRAARAAGSSQTWSSDFLTFPKFTHANPRGLSRPQADLPESTHCFVATGISDCRGTGRNLGFEKDCRRSAYYDRVTYLARRLMKVFRETLNSQV